MRGGGGRGRRRARGEPSASSPVPSGEASSTTSTVPSTGGSQLASAARVRATTVGEVLPLVVGGEDDPERRSWGAPSVVDRMAVHARDHGGSGRCSARAMTRWGSSPQRFGRCQPTIHVGRCGDAQEMAAGAPARRGGAHDQAPGVRVRAGEAGVVADVRAGVHDVLRVAGPRVVAHVARRPRRRRGARWSARTCADAADRPDHRERGEPGGDEAAGAHPRQRGAGSAGSPARPARSGSAASSCRRRARRRRPRRATPRA